VKHESFKQFAIDEALSAIESSVLPSLTLLLESAAAAQPGLDADAQAQEVRALACQLEELTRLLDAPSGRRRF